MSPLEIAVACFIAVIILGCLLSIHVAVALEYREINRYLKHKDPSHG